VNALPQPRAYHPPVPAEPELRTERLLLRRWGVKDLEPCAAMNADDAVMEHLPATQSRAETAAFIERLEASFDECGYGLWVVELRGEARFVGCVGLLSVEPELPFAPAVEIGWRLARDFWSRGIATEAATAAINYGFQELALPTIVSFTAERNLRSRNVMARLGMLHDESEDFSHPALPLEHRLSPHVLYRTDPVRWRALAGT
jgi:RimJ/RimL family protein N-acetyltransferase